MNARPDDQALLDQFRQWLEQTRAEADALPEAEEFLGGASESRPVGLRQVIEEFTALRHEVKLQTKSSRGLAERTEQVLALSQQAMEQLRAVEAQEAEAARGAAKPLVESLMELDEALGRGRAAIDTARRRILADLTGAVQTQLDDLVLRLPWWKRRLCRAWCRQAREILVQRAGLTHREIFDALVEGYQLILNRLQRAMKKAELYRIESVGQPVDPNRMTVIEAVDDPLRPPGLVVEEVRPGYYWKGKVLRFAEVRAVQGRTA